MSLTFLSLIGIWISVGLISNILLMYLILDRIPSNLFIFISIVVSSIAGPLMCYDFLKFFIWSNYLKLTGRFKEVEKCIDDIKSEFRMFL